MRPISTEEIESQSLFYRYIGEAILETLIITLTESAKPADFEFIYGEGSYEQFILGGAPGL